MTHRVSLLGVPIDPVRMDDVQQNVMQFLRTPGQHHIVTPNPEMLVEAERNHKFKEVLQQSSLNIPDGIGLLWAARWSRQYIPARITGTDTLQALCVSCQGERIFLLGAAQGVAESAATKLKEHIPHLNIVGTYAGSPTLEEEEQIRSIINNASPTLLFVAYGAPQQDLWIHRMLPSLPSVKVAMGVGGAFDFIAGVQKRAPDWMQRCGLEWLWRLLNEPQRWKRIINAVIVFPWLVMRSTSQSPTRDSRESHLL